MRTLLAALALAFAPIAASQTIVDVAAGSDDFETLVTAVQAAGLVDVLSSEGPFTVFAPTDDAFADALAAASLLEHDPLWRMPLWDGYDSQLDGTISDLKNTGDGPFAGSITAALFLRRFTGGKRWCHFDIFAWNPKDRPGRPMGGEMLGSRAAWEALKSLYGK